MFKIEKKFTFSASHKLSGLPGDHPCSRDHGHNYTVTVVLEKKDLDKVGFVRDYRELDQIKEWIDDHLDHRNLSDVFTFNTTAELLAQNLFQEFHKMFRDLTEVSVDETDKTSATYRDTWAGR